MELFQLLGTIAIDNSKANAEIDETTGHAQQAESKMGAAFKKIGKVVVAAFATGAVVNFGKKCVEAAATAKALNSQFEQVFDGMGDAAEKSLSSVADQTGIVETRLKGSFTKIAAFAKTTGMDTADALSLTERATLAAADSAAYYDRSIEEVTENLQSFLKGNYENDAALGLSCTETTRNAAANKLYGKSFKDLSESQKQLTLMQMVEDANELSGAMGQAAREADGWENVTGNLKQTWTDFLAVIGSPILSGITPIIQGISGAMSKVTEGIKTFFDTISNSDDPVAAATTMMVNFGNGIAQKIPEFVEKAPEMINKFLTKLLSLLPSIIKGGGSILVGIVTGIINAIPKLVAAVPKIVTTILNGLKNNLPKILQAGIEIVGKLIAGLIKALPSLIAAVPKLVIALAKAFLSHDWKGTGVSIVKAVISGLKSMVSSVGEVGKNLVQGLWNGINNAKDWVIDKVKGFGDSILQSLKDFFGIHSPSTVAEKQIGKNLALGVANGITKNAKYAKKSAAELGQLIVDAAYSKLDTYKTYNNMTLAAEVEFWNQIRKQCKKGTDARIQADKEYYNAKKELNDQLIDLEQEYQDKIDAATQKIADRTQAILQAFNLFDEFTQSDPIESSTLVDNLQSQVDALDDWTKEMATLKGKIGDTDLYAAVQEMGVESLAQVKAINAMTEEQLTKYVELYNKRQELAKEQATSELGAEVVADMKKAYEEYEAAVTDLGATVNEKYALMSTIIKTSMTDSDKITTEKLQSMTDTFKNGTESMVSSMKSSLTKINSNISSSMASAVAKVRAAVAEMNAALATVGTAVSDTSSGQSATVSESKTVSFHAEGAILKKPTVFGYSNGTYHVGGEAGAEAVAPIDVLQDYVRTAVAESSNNADIAGMLAQIITLLQQLLKATGNTKIELGGREFGRMVKDYAG